MAGRPFIDRALVANYGSANVTPLAWIARISLRLAIDPRLNMIARITVVGTAKTMSEGSANSQAAPRIP